MSEKYPLNEEGQKQFAERMEIWKASLKSASDDKEDDEDSEDDEDKKKQASSMAMDNFDPGGGEKKLASETGKVANIPDLGI